VILLPMADAEDRNHVAHAVDYPASLLDAHDNTSARWPEDVTSAVDAVTAALVNAGIEERRAGRATTVGCLRRNQGHERPHLVAVFGCELPSSWT
jgi:hypothetical protein